MGPYILPYFLPAKLRPAAASGIGGYPLNTIRGQKMPCLPPHKTTVSTKLEHEPKRMLNTITDLSLRVLKAFLCQHFWKNLTLVLSVSF